jgi:hypothetical protein
MPTANYGFGYIATNQASKEVTANATFDAIDSQMKTNDTAAEKTAHKNTAGGYPGLVAAPSTATSAGTAGSIAYDGTHIYVCVATNTWVRATLATF